MGGGVGLSMEFFGVMLLIVISLSEKVVKICLSYELGLALPVLRRE